MHHFGPKDESATPDALEVADLIGGPSRTRTLDPLIKSRVQKRTQSNTSNRDVGNAEAST